MFGEEAMSSTVLVDGNASDEVPLSIVVLVISEVSRAFDFLLAIAALTLPNSCTTIANAAIALARSPAFNRLFERASHACESLYGSSSLSMSKACRTQTMEQFLASMILPCSRYQVASINAASEKEASWVSWSYLATFEAL